MGLGFDHAVEDYEQLAHAGGDDDFGLFALSGKALCKGVDDGIPSFGAEGCHVQGNAYRSASTADRAFSLEATAITVEGGQADECGNLVTVECSQFRKIGQESGGSRLADAGSALQELSLSLPLIVGLDEGEDVLLNPFQFFVEGVDHLLDAPADIFRRDCFLAVCLGSAQVDELPPSGNELAQFGLFFMDFRDRPRLDLLSKPRDHRRIDAVGLCQNAQGFGEVTHLTRINDGHAMTGGGQFGHELPLVTTRRFDNHEADAGIRQLTDELPLSLGFVGNIKRVAGRQAVNVQGILGDVDANKRGDALHGEIPPLRMRARNGFDACSALAAVRAYSTKPTTITLPHGLLRPRQDRSVAGGRGRAYFATLSKLSHGCLNGSC